MYSLYNHDDVLMFRAHVNVFNIRSLLCHVIIRPLNVYCFVQSAQNLKSSSALALFLARCHWASVFMNLAMVADADDGESRNNDNTDAHRTNTLWATIAREHLFDHVCIARQRKQNAYY